MFNQTIVENELSKRSKHIVRFSYETYASDDFFIYRKVLVDNRDTNIKVALDQLQSAHACGTLEQKYEELLSQINKHTNL